MALVPLEGEAKAADSGVLDVTDRQIQQAGVRFGKAARRDLVKTIDTYGEIAYDERRLGRITSWVAGRVEKLHVNFTGESVRKGDLLAELYSGPLIVAVGQLGEAKKALSRLKEGRPHESALRQAEELVASTRVLLVRQGLESSQVREIEKAVDAGRDPLGGSTIPTLPIRAKTGGVVIEKKVEEGEYVREGTELLRIADLTTVWLYAEIYENELPFVRVNDPVVITTRARPAEEFQGTVAFIDPFLQRKTRTVRVRIDIPNEEGKLKPGMFARARIRRALPGVLAVPESAVLHSGMRKIAMCHDGKGRFRPTLLRLGRMWLHPAEPDAPRWNALDFALDQYERYHEVLGGLAEGDEVVVAGNFLLSAEAQFQGLLKKLMEDEAEDEPPSGGKTGRCAWDGMEMPAEKMTRVEDGGETLHFCSAEEESEYHRAPEKSWHHWMRAYRTAMEAVLLAYFAVGDSLADDHVAKDGFAKIAETARLPEPRPHFDRHAVETMSRRMEAVRQAAAKGAETGDLVEQRRAYGLISIELVEYVRSETPEKIANGEVHGYRCGMAGSRHGIATENWLQREPGRRNPYMGREMFG
ncbi:MAG: efflux RND transporter periplasmic adaptor subunit [Planctomycetes bacterium]|nr:efflux RND transporter periplasmic adaptor subunit [Planctomycetota bacterium]